MSNVPKIFNSLLVSVAIYPVVLVGVWGLVALGVVAADLEMPTDVMPLVYGLAFAVMTVALLDLLGVASVVLGLVAIANLIEYAQLLVPGRSASAVDFVAGFAGIVFAATLVWAARTFLTRINVEDPEDPDITTSPADFVAAKIANEAR